MQKCGLSDVVPTRANKSKARSLLAQINRDPMEWNTKPWNFTQSIKKQMLGRFLQVLTIVLMSTSCYTFAGEIYKQANGAGIGERASACIARIVMSQWDKLWAALQIQSGLFSPLFIRYVDDVRIYLYPINNGWRWNNGKWVYNKAFKDDSSFHDRTKANILRSLNGIIEGIELTIETEADFSNGMLPTLDFQTRVRCDGEIEFLHFTKPMASNLLVQNGTALGKQTIFASLRQDLIRRLTHVSDHYGESEEIKIVENFTQNLANSGHKYSFSKSIILQALTRFKTMKMRSNLDEADPRHLPLYRNKWYDFDRRCMIKKTLGKTWYSGKNFGDLYKQEWKRRMKRKGDNKRKNVIKNAIKLPPPATVMFVPSSCGGILLKMLENLESELWDSKDVTWSVKLVEQSGKQLRHMFNARMPIVSGCPLGKNCLVCDGDAIKCTTRNVVYLAECEDCRETGTVDGVVQEKFLSDSWYVGETSRPLRMRAREHHNKLLDYHTESFMFIHWMNSHGLNMTPPRYSFKILGAYTDCLSRQISEAIQIEEKGILNKRSEYGSNHLPRLEAVESEQDRNKLIEVEARKKANQISNLHCFKSVVLEVCNKVNELSLNYCDCDSFALATNGCNTCRPKRKKIVDPNSVADTEFDQARAKRRKKMLSSTPIWDHRCTESKDSTADSLDTDAWARNLSSDSSGLESYLTPVRGRDNGGQGSAGLTPALNKLLIRPVDEDEFQTTRKLLQETINLTRTAILKGIIEEDINLEEFSIKLNENSLYRSFAVPDPLHDLFKNLDLNDWSIDDFETYEILHRPNTRSRMSVLNHLAEDKKINMDLYPGSFSYECSTWVHSPLDVTPACVMIADCNGQSATSFNTKVLHEDDACESIVVVVKRKDISPALSPSNPDMEGRASKFQRGNQENNGSSPVLKIRRDFQTKPVSPPASGVLTCPVVGRISKQKRRLSTPKRSYTPDKKQTLITSMFSPRVLPQKDDENTEKRK